MENMKCIECCLKHLGASLSYGKEIISGHDASNDLDHRIDLLGELVNLQHHLFLINNMIYDQAVQFRRLLQGKQMAVDEADLEKIRILYKKVQQLSSENIIKTATPRLNKNIRNNSTYKVIFDDVKNIEHFNLSYQMLKLNVVNDIQIYAISNLDLPNEVKKVTSLIDFVQQLDENEQFIYMKENYFITKTFDFNLLVDIYLQEKADGYANTKYFAYKWNAGTPHIMKKQLFLSTYEANKDVETNYYIKNEVQPIYNAYQYVIRLSDKICCGNKNRINQVPFVVTLTDSAFNQLQLTISKKQK